MGSPATMKPVRCAAAAALLLLLCLAVGPTLAERAPKCWFYKRLNVVRCEGFTGAPEHKFVPSGDCAIDPPEYKLDLESSSFPGDAEGAQSVGCAFYPARVPLEDNTRHLTFGAYFSFQITKNREGGSSGFAFVLGHDLQDCGNDTVGYGGGKMSLASVAVVFKNSPTPCVAITSDAKPVGENCELAPANEALPVDTYAYDEVMYAAVFYAGSQNRFLVYLAPVKDLLSKHFLVMNVTTDIAPEPNVQVGFTGGTTSLCNPCVGAQPQKILSLHFTGGRF